MSDTVEIASGGPAGGSTQHARFAAHAAADPADRPVVRALLDLRRELVDTQLLLPVAGGDSAVEQRDGLVDQLDDYLVPRLRSVDAPLLGVIGGSTGSGKSTLVNSLLRVEVSRTGVLRPTTRSPVLVHHPRDGDWFTSRRILPGLARDYGAEEPLAPEDPITAMRLVSTDALPAGVALLDAPDIDSVVDSNRAVAAQLLAAADLWIFVTTAARYADAVPWEFLHAAAARSATLAVVLNRVPPDAIDEVRRDLARLLGANDLGASPVFTIAEGQVDAGLLSREAVAPLAAWLSTLAADDAARDVVVRRTLAGALDTLAPRVDDLAVVADRESETAARLRASVLSSHQAALDRFATSVSDGSMLRGEVLARWQDLVGTGDFMRQVESGIGRVRDRVVGFVRGRPTPAERLSESIGTATATLVTAQVAAASEETAHTWRADPAGAAVLADHPGLALVPGDLQSRTERLVRDWQGGVIDLVTQRGAGKRRAARFVSLGVNGAGVVLMLSVFSLTGGLSGVEAGVAAGTAALSQRLLEAVFGDQAVRELATRARDDLVERVGTLLDTERDRWLATVPDRPGGDGLRASASRLQESR